MIVDAEAGVSWVFNRNESSVGDGALSIIALTPAAAAGGGGGGVGLVRLSQL